MITWTEVLIDGAMGTILLVWLVAVHVFLQKFVKDRELPSIRGALTPAARRELVMSYMAHGIINRAEARKLLQDTP